ncbi:hypothetical protein B0H14DRAFT_2647538 [Mycena olivaceomarginata]|nr:hypothetical protein B0H14DRAFT_2647538 [Mycena olivaceomarginata]
MRRCGGEDVWGSPSPGPSALVGYGSGRGASSNNNGCGFEGEGLLLSDGNPEIGPSNTYGGGFGQRRREDSLSGRYDDHSGGGGGGGERMGGEGKGGEPPDPRAACDWAQPVVEHGLGAREARGGGGADIRGGGAGAGGGGGKDWASDVSAYFSPPQELNVNTNLGAGGRVGRGEFPQCEGGGGGGGGARRDAAPVSPMQRYASAGQGQGQASSSLFLAILGLVWHLSGIPDKPYFT